MLTNADECCVRVWAVCAGCLALYDAGVPLKKAVAGVAMGLLLPENLKVLILLYLLVQSTKTDAEGAGSGATSSTRPRL